MVAYCPLTTACRYINAGIIGLLRPQKAENCYESIVVLCRAKARTQWSPLLKKGLKEFIPEWGRWSMYKHHAEGWTRPLLQPLIFLGVSLNFSPSMCCLQNLPPPTSDIKAMFCQEWGSKKIFGLEHFTSLWIVSPYEAARSVLGPALMANWLWLQW